MEERPLIAITGAAGHVGGALVRRLLEEEQYRLRVLVREDRRALEGLALEEVRGDILSVEDMDRFCEGADFVVHLAAMISISGPRGGRVEATNVVGARVVAEAALRAGVRRLIHVGSIHAFDIGDEEVDEATPLALGPGHLAYDGSKARGLVEVMELSRSGLDVVALLPTSVIGPHDHKPSRMGRFFLAYFRRRLPALTRGGFDFVDVRDVAEGIVASLHLGKSGQRYLLGGHSMSIPELGDLLQEVTGVSRPKAVVSLGVARLGAPIMDLWARISKREPLFTSEALHALAANPKVRLDAAREALGYHPRPLAETLSDTYRWFVEQGMVARK